jgi:hypothetical protein
VTGSGQCPFARPVELGCRQHRACWWSTARTVRARTVFGHLMSLLHSLSGRGWPTMAANPGALLAARVVHGGGMVSGRVDQLCPPPSVFLLLAARTGYLEGGWR